jgi:hypothetical protein
MKQIMKVLKNMRLVLGLLIFSVLPSPLLDIAVPGFTPPVSAATVTFPDANLKTVIREAIGKPSGDISEADLLGLTSLHGEEAGIIDLTGLEYCIDLTHLYLYKNQIKVITPVQNLTKLELLLLGVNQIEDISPVQNLSNLTDLQLQVNQISDISPVQDLTNLHGLYLSFNQISDISPVQNLTNLTGLVLSYNQINDIQPLVDNTGLSSGDRVYLSNNPLNCYSISYLIPDLEAKGVIVEYFEYTPTDINGNGVPDACEMVEIDVSPLSLSFGNVKLGSSVMNCVTISSIGETVLTVDDIDFQVSSSGDYSIAFDPYLLPVSIPSGGILDIEIIYTPSTLGSSSAVLEIYSDDPDPDRTLIKVELSGTGVEAELPPLEQIADILEFFDMSVDDGTLVGDGPGRSAERRLKALRNMIEAAGDLIEDGLIEEACDQLRAAYHKTDGQPRPGDFVKGDAAWELADMIQDLMTSLECQ